MKTPLGIVLCLRFALHFARAAAPQNAFAPDQIHYDPPPPFLAPGAMLAMLERNPMASSGNDTVFLKMPDGYRIAAHWHPKWENDTVITGNFRRVWGTNSMKAKR